MINETTSWQKCHRRVQLMEKKSLTWSAKRQWRDDDDELTIAKNYNIIVGRADQWICLHVRETKKRGENKRQNKSKMHIQWWRRRQVNTPLFFDCLAVIKRITKVFHRLEMRWSEDIADISLNRFNEKNWLKASARKCLQTLLRFRMIVFVVLGIFYPII